MSETSQIARRAGRPATPVPRAKLIAIAQAAFAQDGYAATSLNSIAEQAGIRKSSLYHHFATKKDLYTAVLESIVGSLRELIFEAKLDQGGFPERLDRLGTLVVDYLVAHPLAARLLVAEVLGRGPFMRGRGSQEVENSVALTGAFLQAGMDAGAFRRQDPKQLALSIVGLHLFYFAATDVSSAIIGRDIFSKRSLTERKRAILEQVRRLCLAPAEGIPG